MTTRIDRHQWEVHAAYRLGWEVRFNYYQRLVRGIMAMLEDAQNLMKVDDMDDAVRSIGRVLIELEDTWAILALRRAGVLSERADHRLPERAGHDRSGAS